MSSFVTWFTSRAIERSHSFSIIEMGRERGIGLVRSSGRLRGTLARDGLELEELKGIIKVVA